MSGGSSSPRPLLSILMEWKDLAEGWFSESDQPTVGAHKPGHSERSEESRGRRASLGQVKILRFALEMTITVFEKSPIRVYQREIRGLKSKQ